MSTTETGTNGGGVAGAGAVDMKVEALRDRFMQNGRASGPAPDRHAAYTAAEQTGAEPPS